MSHEHAHPNFRPILETVVPTNATKERVHELETCLNRMILAYDNTLSDSEGHWPQADTGCIDCTSGTVPDKYNTGPCAYHTAKRLLGRL